MSTVAFAREPTLTVYHKSDQEHVCRATLSKDRMTQDQMLPQTCLASITLISRLLSIQHHDRHVVRLSCVVREAQRSVIGPRGQSTLKRDCLDYPDRTGTRPFAQCNDSDHQTGWEESQHDIIRYRQSQYSGWSIDWMVYLTVVVAPRLRDSYEQD